MRRFCLYFLILLPVLAVPLSASAQDELTLNQTYRDVIRLNFPTGKTQIPLPEGEWELLGLGGRQSNDGTEIRHFSLARVEDGILLGQVIFFLNYELSYDGWKSVDLCEKDKFYFVEIRSNVDNDVDCWISDPEKSQAEIKNLLGPVTR